MKNVIPPMNNGSLIGFAKVRHAIDAAADLIEGGEEDLAQLALGMSVSEARRLLGVFSDMVETIADIAMQSNTVASYTLARQKLDAVQARAIAIRHVGV